MRASAVAAPACRAAPARARGAATPRRRRCGQLVGLGRHQLVEEASTCRGGIAPVNSATTLPSRNAFTAGMPWTRNACGEPLVRRRRRAWRARPCPSRARGGLLEGRAELPARPAPLGPEVDHHGHLARALDHLLLEVRLVDVEDLLPAYVGRSAVGLLARPRPCVERDVPASAARPGRRACRSRSTTSMPFVTLPSERVVGRQAGVGAGDDVELAAGGAGRLVCGLRHRHDALRVRARPRGGLSTVL